MSLETAFVRFLVVALIASPLASPAASYTWTGAGGASNTWSNGTNWLGGAPSAGGASDAELYFSFSDPSASTTSSNNFSGVFTLNKLAITATTGGNKNISGSSLDFVNNGQVGPRIEQNGTIQSAIGNAISIGSGVNLSLSGGTSGAPVTFNGKISGLGSIAIESAVWVFNNSTNDFSGGITVTGGHLAAQTNNAFGTGAIVLQGGTIRATSGVVVTATNAVQIAGNINLGSNSPATSKLTLTGPITITGGTARTLTLSGNSGTAAPVVFAGAIGESGGSSGLSIGGTGVLEMSGATANTYTGLTTVNSGNATLLLNKTGANAVAGNLTLSNGTIRLGQAGQIADTSTVNINGGTFDLNGNSETVGQIAGTGGVITSGISGAVTLTVGGTGSQVTLTTSIQDGAGVVGLVKQGNDALILSGANTHSGGTTLNSGQLVLNGNSALGNGALILNGGILRTTDATSRSFSNSVQIGGDVQFGIATTQSTLTLSGATTILGSNATRIISVNSSTAGNVLPVVFSGAIGDGGNHNGLVIQGAAAGGNATRVVFGGGAADAAANTYTGLTSVGGAFTTATLLLDKAAGTDAIHGDLAVGSTGMVYLNRANQIANTSTVTLSSGGNFAFAPGSAITDNGVDETIANLNMTGGTLNTDPSAGGGASTVSITNGLNFSGGLFRINPTSTMVASSVQVSGTSSTGFRIGGTLEVGSGGLTLIQNDNAPNSSGDGFFNIIQLAAGNSNDGVDTGTIQGGTMKLNGNITTVASATNTNGLRLTIGAGGTNSNVDVNGAVRTFNIANGAADVDFQINPRLTDSVGGGGFVKTGAGTMVLDGGGAGSGFAGSATINEGTLRYVAGAAGINTLGGSVTVSGSTAILDMNGRSDTVGAVVLDNQGTIQSSVAGGTLSSSSGFDVRSGSVSATLGGSGASLTKTTSGTVTLSAVNTYTGTTSINAGTLLLSGSGAIGNSTAIDVASGAVLDVSSVSGGFALGTSQTLKGNGVIRGAVTIEGSLAPGSSPGLLTFEDSLTLGSSSETVMELVGTSRGVAGGYDAVNVGAMLTYGGDLVLNITSGLSYGIYNLFDFASESGGWAAIAFSGGYYTGTWTDNGGGVWTAVDTGGSGQSFTFTESTGDLQVVPEPSASLLAGLGLGLAGGWLRRFPRKH